MMFLENTGVSPPSMSGLLGGSDVILGNAFNNALLGHGSGNRIDGSAGQAYRLYQAAFDRKPDPKGLGGWIKFLDEGHSLLEVSSFFLQSPEFTTRHGASINNDQFVRLMYQNVLHRGPDVEGYLSWMGLLNTHQQSKEQVLIGFSESTENQAALIGVIQNGMEYIPAI